MTSGASTLQTEHPDTAAGTAAAGAREPPPLPFSAIPHTTRLFADFLCSFDRVRDFYSQPPSPSQWPTAALQRPDYDAQRRARVAAVLERQNKTWGAPAATLRNIERLRDGAVAVVTGKQ